MIRFLLKRLAGGFLVILGLVIVVFLLFMGMGDPARLTLGQRADISTLESVQKDLGLDKPKFQQLLFYMNDLSPVSVYENTEQNQKKYSWNKLANIGSNKALVLKWPYLRRSYQSQQNVSELLLGALPNTGVLAMAAFVFAAFFGVLFGVIAAMKHNTWVDSIIMVIANLGVSVPSFFAAILIAWLFGYVLSEYTGLNMFGSLYEIDPFKGRVLALQNLLLPAIALGLRPLSIITQLTRSSMLDVLAQDYVRTAKAKGLSNFVVVVRHALRNALNPVVTAVSGWFASLLAGAFFIEFIFGWRGFGKVTVDALLTSDFPVVMGAVLFIAVIFVMINILVDILYGVLDPRVRIN